MRYVIEVEEDIKKRHRIFVDIKNEHQLDNALNEAEYNCTLDEYIDTLGSFIHISGVDENTYEDSNGVEYFDSYEDEEDNDG